MASELTIESIRKRIADESVQFVRRCELSKEPNSAFVFRTFPGSGKTTSVMKAIADEGYNWIYLSPFHDIIVENLKYSDHYEYNFTHLKGKNQEGMCLAKDYKEYAKQGFNITPFCEGKCPLKENGCPYYDIRNKIESEAPCWAGVHAHIPTYLQSFLFEKKYNRQKMYKSYDVIIIDEFPFQVLYNQAIVRGKDISELNSIIDEMDEDTKEKQFIRKFLEILWSSLISKDKEIEHARLSGLIKTNRGLDLKKFYNRYEETLLDLVSNDKIKEVPKSFLFNIIKIHEENPNFLRIKWMIYKNTKGMMYQRGIYLTVSNVKYFRNFQMPIIVLDATADVNVWKALLGKNINVNRLDIDIEYKNLYQLKTDAHYPASTWTKIKDNKVSMSKSGERLMKLIVYILKTKKKCVLLCSNKKVWNLIEGYLKGNHSDINNYRFANYYNLRSRNDFYEDCDTCILTHEPNIPQLQIEIIGNSIDWDEDLLHDLMTRCEMRQAMGRIRQNILETPHGRDRVKRGRKSDEKIEIYVLPGAIEQRNKIDEKAMLVEYEMLLGGYKSPIPNKILDCMDYKTPRNMIEICELFNKKTKLNITERKLKPVLLKLRSDGFIRRIPNKGHIRVKDIKEIQKSRYVENGK